MADELTPIERRGRFIGRAKAEARKRADAAESGAIEDTALISPGMKHKF